MKRRILTAAGFLCVTLGVIGIFLPVLPTTPFLLLASWLFLRGNTHWREWLLTHPRLGIYIRHYIDYHAIPLRTKVISVSLLWLTMTISIILVHYLWLRILLFAIAIAVTIHILSMKTLDHTKRK